MADYKRVEKEYVDALLDVYHEREEYGKPCTFHLNAESAVTRDKYNSLKSLNTPVDLPLKAFPVEYRPTARQYEQAGIRNQGDVLLYTAKKDWDDASVDFHDIDIVRTHVSLEKRSYEVVDKNRIGQIGDDYLYFVFSLKTR